jgi:hypothetical protein
VGWACNVVKEPELGQVRLLSSVIIVRLDEELKQARRWTKKSSVCRDKMGIAAEASASLAKTIIVERPEPCASA